MTVRPKVWLGDGVYGAIVAGACAIVASVRSELVAAESIALVAIGVLVPFVVAAVLSPRRVAPVVGPRPADVPPRSQAPSQATPDPAAPIRLRPALHGWSLTRPKLGAPDSENEDALDVAVDRGRVVVSDGASSSFAAADWSASLVATFGRSSFPASLEDLSRSCSVAAQQWADVQRRAGGDSDDAPWWAQEGLRRGAFATLLCVEVVDRTWRAVAVGDSCVIQFRRRPSGWSVVSAFPVEASEAFGRHPALVGSNAPVPIDARWAEGAMAAGDILVVATDGVAEWILGRHPGIDTLLCGSVDEVSSLIDTERAARRMPNDDVTLVRLQHAETV